VTRQIEQSVCVDKRFQMSAARRLGHARGFHDPADYRDLAQSETATPDELTILATSEYPFVVQAVAANPRTPRPVLCELVPAAADTEQNTDLLRALARNPSLPHDALRGIAQILMPLVDTTHPHMVQNAVLALYERPDVPEDLLHELLDAPQATRKFKKLVAARTTRPGVRERLLADPSEAVRRAASRPRT